MSDLSILPIQPIIRGYAARTLITFLVTNIHPSFIIVPPLHIGTNFNYTIYLDEDPTMTNILSVTSLGPFLAVCNATGSAVAPYTSIAVWCCLNLTVPRAECWRLSRICARVAPSEDGGTSYREHSYIKTLLCANISALINCPGKASLVKRYSNYWPSSSEVCRFHWWPYANTYPKLISTCAIVMGI